jgi:hypothetical protein
MYAFRICALLLFAEPGTEHYGAKELKVTEPLRKTKAVCFA